MKRLYNADHQPAVVEHGQPAVMPGEAHNFTDEQVEAGITGVWSEDAPRKRSRAENNKSPEVATIEPAAPGEDEK